MADAQLSKEQNAEVEKLVEEKSLEELSELLTIASNEYSATVKAAHAKFRVVRKAFDKKAAIARLNRRFEGMSAEEKELLQELQPKGIESEEKVGEPGSDKS